MFVRPGIVLYWVGNVIAGLLVLIGGYGLLVSDYARAEHPSSELEINCLHAVKMVGPKPTPSWVFLTKGTACLEYINGFIDGTVLFMSLSDVPPTFCTPKEGIKSIHIARIFLKHIKANPEQLHESARSILTVALRDAFPC